MGLSDAYQRKRWIRVASTSSPVKSLRNGGLEEQHAGRVVGAVKGVHCRR
jgi:hypothetical protein